MSSIYKNGEYWYYQTSIEVDGRMKRKQITLKTRDEKVARKRQQIYDRKYEDLKNPFLNTRELLSKTKEEYIEYHEKQVKRLVRSQRTLDSDRGVLKSFEDFIKNKYGEIYLNEIRKKDIEDYKEKRLDEDNVNVTTLGVNLRHLKSFFSYQRKKDKIEVNPMEGVEIEPGERREFVPLDEDWNTLYEHLSEEMKSKEYDWFKTLIWILVNKGESIFNISKIVGHSVKEVTEFIYAHHTPKNLEKTISKIREI